MDSVGEKILLINLWYKVITNNAKFSIKPNALDTNSLIGEVAYIIYYSSSLSQRIRKGEKIQLTNQKEQYSFTCTLQYY